MARRTRQGLDAQLFHERAARLAELEHPDFRAQRHRKLRHRQPNGSGAHDQCVVPGFNPTALDSVKTDAEGFDQRQLIER